MPFAPRCHISHINPGNRSLAVRGSHCPVPGWNQFCIFKRHKSFKDSWGWKKLYKYSVWGQVLRHLELAELQWFMWAYSRAWTPAFVHRLESWFHPGELAKAIERGLCPEQHPSSLQDRKESGGMAFWEPCYMKSWVFSHPVAAHQPLKLQKHLKGSACHEWWCSVGLVDAGWHSAEPGRGLRKESKWNIAFGALKARR